MSAAPSDNTAAVVGAISLASMIGVMRQVNLPAFRQATLHWPKPTYPGVRAVFATRRRIPDAASGGAVECLTALRGRHDRQGHSAGANGRQSAPAAVEGRARLQSRQPRQTAPDPAGTGGA